MKNITIILVLFFPLFLRAQFKFEQEYRVKLEMIPLPAKQFVDSINPNARIKWFKDKGLKETTLEAKFKHNNKKFSVEFDTLGKLQDVEFVIKKSDLNREVYGRITNQLDSLYLKWKFQKIQLNYVGNSKEILKVLINELPNKFIQVSYEIVLKGKTHQSVQLFEIHFNEQGELLDVSQIIPEKSDHLEY